MIDWVLSLREDIGVPHTLRGTQGRRRHGSTKSLEMAIVDPTAGGNPVKFDRAAARQVFAAALDGKL